jgi:hypothetical protein
MSNPPPVKTPLSEPTPGGPSSTDVTASAPAAPEPAADPKVTALLRLLRPVAEAKVHPEVEARLPQSTSMEVSLDTHRLRVLQGSEVLVDAPVATGRALSPTPEGSFTLASKPAVPATLRYGHYRTRAGALLVRGVFPTIDPLPAEAVFDEVVPKGLIQLSGEGPLIFGGEATGAATSDGTLIVPDRIALLLHEKLPLGLPVTIAP